MTIQSPGAFERKSEDDDANDIVTKALGDMTETFNKRLSDIEAKADTSKLAERLDKLEAKSNRPQGGEQKAEIGEERKAFGHYLRLGNA
ncbi:MAG: phage major capsid protein, partial [Alterinioella nitratireducens]